MEIKYTLLENAIDSITHGIEHLESAVNHNDKKGFKYSLLHFAQGTELLLKEVLVMINPIIIFDKKSLSDNCVNPLNPKIDELYKCRSIDIAGLISELKQHYSGSFEKIAFAIIKDMARERNKLQHFAIEMDGNELKVKLIRLQAKVINPCYRILEKKIATGGTDNLLNEKLEQIYCFHQKAENEDAMLKIGGEDFSRGVCFECARYSLFIFYDKTSYPVRFYCTSCDFKRSAIDISEFCECPECGAYSLIYDETLQGGTCLWYKCANHRDGGILTDMEYCEKCQNYKIEGQCKCNVKK